MRKELDADEVALRELTDSVLNKLSAIPDEDYEKLELYPDFDEWLAKRRIFERSQKS